MRSPRKKRSLFIQRRGTYWLERLRLKDNSPPCVRLFPLMKAAIYVGQGRFELVEKPMPKRLLHETLLEVSRAGVCGTDLRIFQGHLQNRVGPRRILGHEAIALVRETSSHGKLKTGDRVVVEPTISCGDCTACRQGFTHVCQNLRILGIDQDGAFQHFWTVPDHRLHQVPDAIADDQATMIEPLAVAVHAVRLSALRASETVAIVGAGTIGLLIAMLARKNGAQIVVLENNPYRLEFARQLQFQAFDPKEQAAVQTASAFTEGSGMNVIFEASGSIGGARLMTSLAAVRGRVILVGIHDHETPVDLYQIFSRELSVQGMRAYSSQDFMEAIRLLSAGEINLAPFISKHYKLEQLQQAMELAVSGAPAMKILVDIRSAL
jgi:(R,R)-butanediol dehydrogenase / meso-butanediol dehydrogenase / diacetyl reductase